MRYTIWDLDNCLSNDYWRLDFIEQNWDGDLRYRHYTSLCHQDMPAHKELFLEFRKTATPVIFTNRTDEFREMTERWMIRHFGFSPDLFMRPSGLEVSSAEAKLQMLLRFYRKYNASSKDVVCAFDDQFPIVEMYRRADIPGIHLYIYPHQS